MSTIIISLSLNEDTNKILEDLSTKVAKSNKSEFIRKLLYFFEKNPSEIKRILLSEIGDMQIE